jgi:hypothetical protein
MKTAPAGEGCRTGVKDYEKAVLYSADHCCGNDASSVLPRIR